MTNESLGVDFESGFFSDSHWSVVSLATSIPAIPKSSDPKAQMHADVAWFELGHLQVGEYCRLSGRHNAEFWKIEETTLMCKVDGKIGVYVHDNDISWEERRYAAERIVLDIMTGER